MKSPYNEPNGIPTNNDRSKNQIDFDTINNLTTIAAERLAQIERLTEEVSSLMINSRNLTLERDEQAKLATEYQTLLKSSQDEGELLLCHLHLTQEELEQSLINSKLDASQIDSYRQRLIRTLERHPTYWDFEGFEACVLEDTNKRHIVQWNFTNVDIGERLIPELRFKTVLIDGVAGIIIQRSQGLVSSAPLLRWPAISDETSELSCMPVKGSASHGNNSVLSNLGPTDWKMLINLVKRLSVMLAQPDDSRFPDRIDADRLQRGLLALEKTLESWPAILRYDDIRIDRTFQIDGYHALEIWLSNPQLGNKVWPDFNYRVATFFETGQSFNQNPRIEFPESKTNPLTSWFSESIDERGARMELRFAQPDIMDTNVWNLLVGNDRLLVAALLASTNTQLIELQKRNSTISQPWQDWLTVGESMRRILAKVTASSSNTQGV